MARILIVDDCKFARSHLRIFLHANGHSVREAQSGIDCLSHFWTHTPDLILLDIALTDMDGHEVISSIRQLSTAPIIVVSARCAEMDVIEALERGADDFLAKPYGLCELMARIRMALRHAAQALIPNQTADSHDLTL